MLASSYFLNRIKYISQSSNFRRDTILRNGLLVDWRGGGATTSRGRGGRRVAGEPRNKLSTELHQLLYVSLRKLKEASRKEIWEEFFTKAFPPYNSIHNVFLVSSFFTFFKVSLLGTWKTLLHAMMQEIPLTAYFYSGK